MIELIDTLNVANELGEGVIWDHQRQSLWWTDIQNSQLYRYKFTDQLIESWPTPERLCCFAPIQNSIEKDSRKPATEKLVAAFESGFAIYDPQTAKVDWIKQLETDNPGTRFNDGRTDRQGRLWAGTMVEDSDLATHSGRMYCLHANLSVSRGIGGLSIPNSLCWSPSGDTVYHTDTPTRRINKHSYNTHTGEWGVAEELLRTEPGCFPDGSIVDRDGYLWNAQWGASQVVRYSPDGAVDQVVKIPTSQPTCVAFAGPELNLLVVTSARQDLLAPDAQAGNVFIYQTDYQGIAEQAFIVEP